MSMNIPQCKIVSNLRFFRDFARVFHIVHRVINNRYGNRCIFLTFYYVKHEQMLWSYGSKS